MTVWCQSAKDKVTHCIISLRTFALASLDDSASAAIALCICTGRRTSLLHRDKTQRRAKVNFHKLILTPTFLLLLLFLSPPAQSRKQKTKARHTKLWAFMAATAIYSVTVVLWKETAFPLWRAMERHWKSNVVSWMSSVIVVISLLRSKSYTQYTRKKAKQNYKLQSVKITLYQE